ncbi:MAG: Dabb family protein [Ktedonobacteraceae bacterium]
MMTHVILLQPKASTSVEEITAFLEHVEALQEIIPGILSLYVGENRSEFNGGFTHGIIMRFVDESHLDAHHSHPAHVAVVTELNRICRQSIDFDLSETAQ